MKKDIEQQADIVLMVDRFYDKVKNDELLGPVFNDIMNVNWQKHLQKMYGFWEFILFHTGDYAGRPFPPHLRVNDKIQLSNELFDQWLILFNGTVDEHFEGTNAGIIKSKAKNIQQVWNHKMNYINKKISYHEAK